MESTRFDIVDSSADDTVALLNGDSLGVPIKWRSHLSESSLCSGICIEVVEWHSFFVHCIILCAVFSLNSSLVGLSLTYCISLVGRFQFWVRQSADVENLVRYWPLTHSEQRPKIFIPKRKWTSIVSSNWQQKISLFSLQISKTWCFG